MLHNCSIVYMYVNTLIANKNSIVKVRSFCGSFYCSYLWFQYNKSSFSKIRVACNNLYRKILHVPPHSSACKMFVDNNIPNLEALLREEGFSFTSRLNVSTDSIYYYSTNY